MSKSAKTKAKKGKREKGGGTKSRSALRSSADRAAAQAAETAKVCAELLEKSNQTVQSVLPAPLGTGAEAGDSNDESLKRFLALRADTATNKAKITDIASAKLRESKRLKDLAMLESFETDFAKRIRESTRTPTRLGGKSVPKLTEQEILQRAEAAVSVGLSKDEMKVLEDLSQSISRMEVRRRRKLRQSQRRSGGSGTATSATKAAGTAAVESPTRTTTTTTVRTTAGSAAARTTGSVGSTSSAILQTPKRQNSKSKTTKEQSSPSTEDGAKEFDKELRRAQNRAKTKVEAHKKTAQNTEELFFLRQKVRQLEKRLNEFTSTEKTEGNSDLLGSEAGEKAPEKATAAVVRRSSDGTGADSTGFDSTEADKQAMRMKTRVLLQALSRMNKNMMFVDDERVRLKDMILGRNEKVFGILKVFEEESQKNTNATEAEDKLHTSLLLLVQKRAAGASGAEHKEGGLAKGKNSRKNRRKREKAKAKKAKAKATT